ncbi:VIT family-domain-containing protein [Xylariales sp. PMI_506]|nr:VIT family-domain-containing protein [Xylariales sp. PMI_506]
MSIKNVLEKLSLQPGERSGAYSVVPTTPQSPDMPLSEPDDCAPHVFTVVRPQRIALPSLSRFLADFTLGFADGLTVPFALTAGLSSLGETNTVIFAGMAEIAAGSISMGIGGYLSARGDLAAAATKNSETRQLSLGERDDPEKAAAAANHAVVESYLSALDLPQDLLDAVRTHVSYNPGVATALREAHRESEDYEDPEVPCSPILNGLSVALGYLLGGLLPLFPYFFVTDVAEGVKWSFAVCIVALFVFGFIKHYVLQEDVKDKPRRWLWIRQSAWEGLQMVILGSIAAVAAVLCVKASAGIVS